MQEQLVWHGQVHVVGLVAGVKVIIDAWYNVRIHAVNSKIKDLCMHVIGG